MVDDIVNDIVNFDKAQGQEFIENLRCFFIEKLALEQGFIGIMWVMFE